MEPLKNNLLILIEAIENCRDRKQILPCLALVYTGIDVVASLERKPGEGVGPSFRRWVDDYLVSEGKLNSTANDLYGARCGILHRFSSESDLSKKGRAREVVYAWGTADASAIQAAADELARGDVAIHLDQLIASFKNAVAAYLCDIEKDPARSAAVKGNSGVWLKNMDPESVEQFLRVRGRWPDV